MLRIFDPIMANAEGELMRGDHTRSIAQATPSMKAGGIMQFAKVRAHFSALITWFKKPCIFTYAHVRRTPHISAV